MEMQTPKSYNITTLTQKKKKKRNQTKNGM